MNQHKDFPLSIQINFQKIIDKYKNLLKTETASLSKNYIENMLKYVATFPSLENGIESTEDLVKLKDPIKILMKDFFPEILSHQQIKALSVPFHNIVFNATSKFKEILYAAGEDFSLVMRNHTPDLEYIYGCILILNKYYGYDIDFSKPLYYDIPDKNGILRHYRVDLNLEYIDLKPGSSIKEITREEVDVLLQNIENADLWREKFPPKSWIFKGFTILSLTDVTVADAISDLKTTLLQRTAGNKEQIEKFQEIFKSIYKIPDLRVGFTKYHGQDLYFEKLGRGVPSFLLMEAKKINCSAALDQKAYDRLIKEHKNFSISNVSRYSEEASEGILHKSLSQAGIKSAIIAPIAKNGNLLGLLELVTSEKSALNSVNAQKLDDILPYIVTAIERNRTEYENRVKAVIQSECTTIHPSVLWSFEKEARNFIKDLDEDGLATFKDIIFEDVYPLYGEIDIVASSEARNEAIQRDLLEQLEALKNIVNTAKEEEPLDIYKQVTFRIREFETDLKKGLNASSEQKVFNLLQREIAPVLAHVVKQSPTLHKMVNEYQKKVNSETGIIYNHRKNYDDTVQQINRSMARYIDQKQVEAQKIYPHFFERYKTDGVEHNMYIGASMAHKSTKAFDLVYLYNLRLWQLSTLCEMENRFYQIQQDMPLKLDAASLILVYNSTLSIRYRIDEKHFDVDGTYNARYEIIKKRIDKALVKDTDERISQKGKIAIVYSNRSDEREYLRYIKYLQSKKYLGELVEMLELEDVQGVIGLKAIRVEVLYHLEADNNLQEVFTYADLEKVLNKVVSNDEAEHRENNTNHKDGVGNAQ